MTSRSVLDVACPLTPLQQMAASCSGAMITSLFVTPLDVVKIRLQAQQKAFMSNKCFIFCNGLMDHLCAGTENAACTLSRRPGHFNGTVDAFVKIVQVEGASSLWSGLPPTLVMAIPNTVIYFTSYEQLRMKLSKVLGPSYQLWLVPMLAGSIARLFSATVISPLELVRTKMQSQRLQYAEIGVAIRSLVKQSGFFSLWRGFIPSVLRDVPFSAIYWTSYEVLRAKRGVAEPSIPFIFASGAVSGTIAAILTLPFDVVKTHRQIELGAKEIYSAKDMGRTRIIDPPKQSAKTFQILKRIYSQSGPKALFTGIVPRVIKVAPACAIMISTYEYGKAFFRRYNDCKFVDPTL